MTQTVPIVFTSASDPVKVDLVASLNRPGGNATGIAWLSSALEAKRLGLLHEMVPKASIMGMLVNPDYSGANNQVQDVQEAAARLVAVSARWALLIVGVAAATGIAAVTVYLTSGAEPWLWAAVPACLASGLVLFAVAWLSREQVHDQVIFAAVHLFRSVALPGCVTMSAFMESIGEQGRPITFPYPPTPSYRRSECQLYHGIDHRIDLTKAPR